ncbi:GNAT family N-acetyltransferase [Paenibacillus elgii]|uniref:GNAT family N-acetyltransferase n=1 Tax=Paenibacillus elgii TaxID=189691 RepID=UPI00203D6267|nr:GNAT family N-acetyltransferase [Paenibacillus elgii]MCM3273371.1 GNAT family N-acetyltransferase [Paenibacillus elgii]
MLTLRAAREEDMPWVNEQYREVGFAASDYGNEIIVLAEWNGEKAGVGRLVNMGQDTYEMGGIYVQERFRGKQAANAIVGLLVEEAGRRGVPHVYCIPFAHLESFYSRFGYIRVEDESAVHPGVLKKYRWCRAEYPQETILMKLIP